MEEIVYLNGSLIEREKAFISISDHGFLYGYGLFQTARAYNGKMFLLEKHIQRLINAAQVIGMREKVTAEELERACRDTLKANELKEARVRVTVTNGESTALPWVEAGGMPTVLVTAEPYMPFPEKKYNEGFKVGIASVKRCRQSVLSMMKSINYLISVIARIEATENELDENIVLNDGGYVAEGGSSNIFFVEQGRLLTPSKNNGIIPGVTREVIIKIAKKMGMRVKEADITPDVIDGFDEIFMTNCLIEVMPVVRVSDEEGRMNIIGDGKPGNITKRLLAAYREMVAKETK
jgi:branched-chain amino acid aminotransferase